MPKLKSFLKIKGTLDELTFYEKGGESLVRRKGGVDSNRIKNDPNYARTRENNVEFGNFVQAARLLKNALNAFIKNVRSAGSHNTLSSIMAKIKNMDTASVRGDRNVADGISTSGAIDLLNHFAFNGKTPLSSAMLKQFTLDKTSGAIDIKDLIPMQDLSFPAHATHARFAAAWLRLNFASGESELQISNAVDVPINSTTTTVNLVIGTTVTLSGGNDFYLLKVEYLQSINGVLYSLNDTSKNAADIVGVG